MSSDAAGTPRSIAALGEIRGVRLGDVYRDHSGDLWEVYALCTEPTASVRKISDHEYPGNETHVIGCRNWEAKWIQGPMRGPLMRGPLL